MAPSDPFFPESYVESRQWFREQRGAIRAYWPETTFGTHTLEDHQELSIDWIDTSPSSSSDNLLILSTGLHGIEGYPGAAVLHHFMTRYLHRVDPGKTALLLVHPINPWGMQNRRRANADNIDLNRNFRFGADPQSRIDNPGYQRLQTLLKAGEPLRDLRGEKILFLRDLLGCVVQYGIKQMKEATLLGQTTDPCGLYFGGHKLQEETQVFWNLVTEKIKANHNVVHIDIHTGYGASRRLYLVNSVNEPTSPDVWSERFHYRDVLRTDPEAFYAIEGDMIDALYTWNRKRGVGQNYFGTAFEYGTLGESLSAIIRSLRAVVFENRVFHNGTVSPPVREVVARAFAELFIPASPGWRRAIIRDTDVALQGILSYFGLLRLG